MTPIRRISSSPRLTTSPRHTPATAPCSISSSDRASIARKRYQQVHPEALLRLRPNTGMDPTSLRGNKIVALLTARNGPIAFLIYRGGAAQHQAVGPPFHNPYLCYTTEHIGALPQTNSYASISARLNANPRRFRITHKPGWIIIIAVVILVVILLMIIILDASVRDRQPRSRIVVEAPTIVLSPSQKQRTRHLRSHQAEHVQTQLTTRLGCIDNCEGFEPLHGLGHQITSFVSCGVSQRCPCLFSNDACGTGMAPDIRICLRL